jgi:hypothetical protein
VTIKLDAYTDEAPLWATLTKHIGWITIGTVTLLSLTVPPLNPHNLTAETIQRRLDDIPLLLTACGSVLCFMVPSITQRSQQRAEQIYRHERKDSMTGPVADALANHSHELKALKKDAASFANTKASKYLTTWTRAAAGFNKSGLWLLCTGAIFAAANWVFLR